MRSSLRQRGGGISKLSLRASWAERSELRKLGTASEVPDYAESLSAMFAEVPYVAAKYVQKTRVPPTLICPVHRIQKALGTDDKTFLVS